VSIGSKSASRHWRDTWGPGPPDPPAAVAEPSGRDADPSLIEPSPERECAKVGGRCRAGEHALLGHRQRGPNLQDNGAAGPRPRSYASCLRDLIKAGLALYRSLRAIFSIYGPSSHDDLSIPRRCGAFRCQSPAELV